ncbi:hypothetical protein Q4I30_002226 [Leishmania utingensis]|uniref:Uncharacterized protein n=1 Tax=Leishmania utingensis TaxID=653362 RepID=A0AAW3AT78_9TRYP
MESAGTGFSMLYRDMTAPPTSYQWECTTGPSTQYSVAYASATAPYTVSVLASTLEVTRPTSTPGVSYSLIGMSCGYDATCGDLKTGASLSFSLQVDQIVLVAGKVTSNGITNFMPAAYYVVQSAPSCSGDNIANVTTAFRVGTPSVWTELWK